MDQQQTPAIVETTIREATINKKYIIRAARTGEGIGQNFAENFLSRPNDKVAIIAAEITFFRDVVKYLEQGDTHKIIKKSEFVLPEEQDFRTFIIGLKSASFQTVAVFLLPNQICTFLRQALEQNYHPRFLGTELFDSKDLIGDCPENINGIQITSMDVSPTFRDRYIQQYRIDNYLSHAGQAYDAANMIARVVSEGLPVGKDSIIKRFAKIKNHQGVVGAFGFSNTYGSKDFLMPIALKRIQNGETTLP